MKGDRLFARRLPVVGGLPFFLASLRTLFRNGLGDAPRGLHRFHASPIDLNHLAEYQSELGFSPSDGVPLTYLYLLAQRAEFGVMLEPEFPFSLLKMAHVANALRWRAAPDPEQPFGIQSCVIDESALGSGDRIVSIESVIRQEWGIVAVCWSQYRFFNDTASLGSAVAGSQSRCQNWVPIGAYELPKAAGWGYARLTGEGVLVHPASWADRILGFERPLIQGMQTVARVAAMAQESRRLRVKSIEAKFFKEIVLPSKVEVRAEGSEFSVRANNHVAVNGSISFE